MGTEKKARKTDEEQKRLVEKLCPMDDVFFEVMMDDPDTCEEMLQIFLENPKLRIKKSSVQGQKSIRIVGKRSVRVDAYAEGNEDKVFNIEIQKADNDNHVKRVRYNASAITVSKSEPGDKFEHVQEVYVIYVSKFDVLGNGLTISHAEMCCMETGEPLNDGLHEIYVNTKGNEDSKIGRYAKELLNPNMNNPEFPKTSKRVQNMKHDQKEVAIVCQLVEEYAAERVKIAEEIAEKKGEKKGQKKGEIKIYYREMHLSAEQIAEKTGLSIKEVKTCISEIETFN